MGGAHHSPKSLRLFVDGGPRQRLPSALGATNIPVICTVPGNRPGVNKWYPTCGKLHHIKPKRAWEVVLDKKKKPELHGFLIAAPSLVDSAC